MNVLIAIGAQPAKGVRATTFKQLYATDYSVAPDVSVAQSSALTGSRFYQGESFVSRINIAGDIPFEATPETLMFLVANAGFAEEGSTGVFKATEKCDKWVSILCHYVAEGAHEIVTDAKINSITINLATEAFVTGTINVIGCSSEFQTTPSTYTVEAPNDDQLICLNSSVAFSGEDRSASLSDATLTINNNLEGASSINSIYNTDVRESNADASLEVSYNRFDKSIYKDGFDKVLEATEMEAVMTLGFGEGKSIEIKCHKAKPTSNTSGDLAGFGSMSQSYNLAYSTADATPITFTWTK